MGRSTFLSTVLGFLFYFNNFLNGIICWLLAILFYFLAHKPGKLSLRRAAIERVKLGLSAGNLFLGEHPRFLLFRSLLLDEKLDKSIVLQ
jgi:hypothetical protein